MGLQDKKAFFDSLDAVGLTSEDDDDLDLDLPLPVPAKRQQVATSKKRKLPLHSADASTPAQPARVDISTSNGKAALSAALDGLEKKRPRPKPRNTATVPAVPSSPRRPPPAKAKSTSAVPTMPPALTRKKSIAPRPTSSLFDGLCFYFLPNNTKNPTRKMKIQRSEENGAKCLFEWLPEEITHIVVEPAYRKEHVLKELKLERIPRNITLVKDNFPSECIHYKQLQDPTLPFYTVPGDTPDTPPPSPPKSEHNEPDNLNNKRRKKDHEYQETPVKAVEGTPPRDVSDRSSSSPSSPTSPPPIQALRPYIQDLDSHTTLNGPPPKPLPPKYSALPAELDSVIQDAKAMPHLDVDPESEDDSEPESGSEDETSSNSRRTPRKPFNKISSDSRWQCMQAHSAKDASSNPNALTIELLSQMQQYYDRTKDTWRALSYRKAITTLKRQTTSIIFASDAIKLPYIGTRLSQKIEEIATTHHLRRLDYTALSPYDNAIKIFLGIYGVGYVQASEWANIGHRSLGDIWGKEYDRLSDSQKVGLERYEDFARRIPREEVKRSGDVVAAALKKLDPEAMAEVMGSYRRGAETCGDIDIMITKRGAEQAELTGLLKKLTEMLEKVGFLKAALAVPRGKDDGSKWHGASQIEEGGPWRRIDFLIVPWKERGAALLYFTGNDIFNRSMRLYASSKGYRLNQRGLYKDVMRGRNREALTEGTLVEGESEKRIFEILGVPYRAPEDRNC